MTPSPSSPVPAVEADRPKSDIHRVRAALKKLHDITADRVDLNDGPAWDALEEAHSAWLWSTPTPGRAAEPGAMEGVERLAEEALIRANLAGLSGNVDYLMAEYRSASDAYKAALASLVTRAETTEAQLATLRAEGLALETTDNDIRWFSQNVPPGKASERYAIDRLVRDHKRIRTLLNNPQADR